MKIWTSPKQGKDYAFKTIFGVSAIVLLMLALSAGGAVFLLSAGLSSAWLSLALCLLVTEMCIRDSACIEYYLSPAEAAGVKLD